MMPLMTAPSPVAAVTVVAGAAASLCLRASVAAVTLAVVTLEDVTLAAGAAWSTVTP